MKILLVVSFVTVLLGWLLPNYYPPWLGAYQSFSAFVALSLCYVWVSVKSQVNTTNYQCIALLLLFVVLLLQFISGVAVYFGEVLIFIMYALGFYSALSIGQGLYNRPNWYASFCKWLAIVFLLAAIVSVWIALKQWLMLNGSIWIADLAPNARPFANFYQPNNLATLLGMGLAAIIYLYEKSLLLRVSASVLALFLLFGLVLTQSRTPWLTGIAVCLFWAWKAYSLSVQQQGAASNASLLNNGLPRLSVKAVFLWYGLFILLTLALPSIADAIGLKGASVVERAQQMQRLDMYKQFALAIYHGPWYGYGINNVAAAQATIAPLYPIKEFTFYTHNILLDILIWFGPIIGGAIIVCCAVWLWKLGRAAQSKESMFALVAAGFILTHSMLEYPHAYAFFFLPLGILLGIAQNEIRDSKRIIVPKPIALGLAALIAVLGSWMMYEYLVIEDDFRLMRFESANVGSLKAEQAAPDVILLTQLREYTRLARTEANAGMSDEEITWMRQVTYQYPYAASFTRYIKALALNDKTDEALQEIDILKSLHKPKDYQNIVYWLNSEKDNYPAIKEILSRLETVEQ